MGRISEIEQVFLHEAQKLWEPGTPLVVGVSGGGDSMALVALLKSAERMWPVEIFAVHVNHGLRAGSDQEARWVSEQLENNWNVPVAVIRPDLVRQRGESIEMAARRVRRAVLLDQAASHGSRALVALAHQADDQAETVLMRVLIGAGLDGLQGMKGLRYPIVRPLLNFSRQELRGYLEFRRVPWIDDPSNNDRHMLRNRIRLEILPELKDLINPRVSEALVRVGQRSHEAVQAFDWILEQLVSQAGLDLGQDPLSLPPIWRSWPRGVQGHLLRRVASMRNLRLGAREIRQALDKTTTWPDGFEVRHLDTGGLLVRRDAGFAIPSSVEPTPLTLGVCALDQGYIESQLVTFDGGIEPGWSYLVYDRYLMRGWHPGDALIPVGLAGHKKVQDIFVDRKIPRHRRHHWPLLERPDGCLAAVVSVAVDDQARAIIGQPALRVRFNWTSE